MVLPILLCLHFGFILLIWNSFSFFPILLIFIITLLKF